MFLFITLDGRYLLKYSIMGTKKTFHYSFIDINFISFKLLIKRLTYRVYFVLDLL